MPPAEQLLGLAAVIVAAALLVFALSRLRGHTDLKLPLGIGLRHEEKPEDASRTVAEAVAFLEASLRLNLDQYGEVATALEAVINSKPSAVEGAAREWFSQLATRLAHLLRQQRDHHYRVAIWLDDPSSQTHFIAVGYGMFDRHDENMERLERGSYTIGGIAFASVTGDYYCRDTRTDPNFKPRKTVPPSFRSVYALALGKLNDRWGVMTVDSRQTNGFPDDAQWLVRRFGELCSLGAVTWASKLTEVPATPGPAAVTADDRSGL